MIAMVFEQKRGFNKGVGELPLLGLIVGAVLGAMIIVWDTRHQHKLQQSGVKPIAEHRLRTALFGGPALAASMFWFGWTAHFSSVHWIVPTIAGGFAAAAMMTIFVSFLNCKSLPLPHPPSAGTSSAHCFADIVDTYLMFAASAIAANTVARSAAGAAAPLFTNQMFRAMGIGGGSSLIGGVAVLLAFIPVLFYKYGESIRIKSRFAPTAPPPRQPSSEEDAIEKGAARPSHDRDLSESTASDGNEEERGARASLDSKTG